MHSTARHRPDALRVRTPALPPSAVARLGFENPPCKRTDDPRFSDPRFSLPHFQISFYDSTVSDAVFTHNVFLTHSAKDKPVVRPLAERLRADGLKVWFDEWEIKPGDSIPAKIEEGLEHSRVLLLCMSANAFGSDWAQLEAGTFRFRDPLNKERRFIPLRLDDTPIKGSLAQFLYINWRPADRELEYAKVLEACRPLASASAVARFPGPPPLPTADSSNREPWDVNEDYVRRRRALIEQAFSIFEAIHAFFFKVSMDYMSLVGVLHMGLQASAADRTKFYDYVQEIGPKLQELHLLEGRLALAGADKAVRSMQQYRLQATEVNNMLSMQLPCLEKNGVDAVANELFRRKDRLYAELAKALRESGPGVVPPPPTNTVQPTSSRIGECWSGLRGLLQQAYSTQTIKGILGKAGLPISQIEYHGTYKGPVLDQADKLVSAMDDLARERFAVGCIQEMVLLERACAGNQAKRGREYDGEVLRHLQQVLARYGHDLNQFQPA